MLRHLLKDLDRCLRVLVPHTHVEQTVVQNLVWLVSKVLRSLVHLVDQLEDPVHIWVLRAGGLDSILVPPVPVGLDALDQT